MLAAAFLDGPGGAAANLFYILSVLVLACGGIVRAVLWAGRKVAHEQDTRIARALDTRVDPLVARLDGLDKAVNNVEPGRPPLVQRVTSLEEAVHTINENVTKVLLEQGSTAAMVAGLREHIAADRREDNEP